MKSPKIPVGKKFAVTGDSLRFHGGYYYRAVALDINGNETVLEELTVTPALIADAPAMLELLREVSASVTSWNGVNVHGPVVDRIDALLAKHGKSP